MSLKSIVRVLKPHCKLTLQSCTQAHRLTTHLTQHKPSTQHIRTFSSVIPDESHNDFAPQHRQSNSSSDTADITELIKHDIEQNPVFLYMKGTPDAPRCGFSANVCRILQHLNTGFASRDVLQSEELRDGVKKFSDWPTIPQLYVNGEFIGGSDIVTQYYKSGELQKLLEPYTSKKPTVDGTVGGVQ